MSRPAASRLPAHSPLPASPRGLPCRRTVFPPLARAASAALRPAPGDAAHRIVASAHLSRGPAGSDPPALPSCFGGSGAIASPAPPSPRHHPAASWPRTRRRANLASRPGCVWRADRLSFAPALGNSAGFLIFFSCRPPCLAARMVPHPSQPLSCPRARLPRPAQPQLASDRMVGLAGGHPPPEPSTRAAYPALRRVGAHHLA